MYPHNLPKHFSTISWISLPSTKMKDPWDLSLYELNTTSALWLLFALYCFGFFVSFAFLWLFDTVSHTTAQTGLELTVTDLWQKSFYFSHLGIENTNVGPHAQFRVNITNFVLLYYLKELSLKSGLS